MLTSSSPIFAVRDVPETVQFYKDVLGFPTSWIWGEPPTFGSANWGKVSMMFALQPDLAGRIEGHTHWLNVEDVNALHSLHLERGAMIVSDIEDKPWGRREYTVRDLNGYHLRFGGPATHESQGTGKFPADVRIVCRPFTVEEYQSVVGEEFYRTPDAEEAYARIWNGVVALDADENVIGTTRIMCDAPGWYSIWDVAVRPEWQGRRIGSALMKAALEQVREASPGAWVYLFTYKGEFYERLGFDKESLHMRKV